MRSRSPQRLLAAGIVAACIVASPVRADDLPCAWLDYNLPVLGADREEECSPQPRPSGWNVERTVKHRQPSGGWHVEVGVEVAMPTG